MRALHRHVEAEAGRRRREMREGLGIGTKTLRNITVRFTASLPLLSNIGRV